MGAKRLVIVLADQRIWRNISLTNSRSYIDGFLLNLLLEIGVHYSSDTPTTSRLTKWILYKTSRKKPGINQLKT